MLRGWFMVAAMVLVGCSLTIDFNKYAQDDNRSTGTGGFHTGACQADPRSPCDVCLSAKCCPQANACYANSFCSAANDQNERCMMQQSAMACYANFGTSNSLAGDLYRCLMGQCPQECALQ